MKRRDFLAGAVAAGVGASALGKEPLRRPRRVLLRSSWQTVNIGDIAHTPGMLALLEKHAPETEVTLWPSSVDRGVEELLAKRFPMLRIAKTVAEQQEALAECDFFLHGSGPGLVGREAARQAMKVGKRYGFGGVTLSDAEIADERELLAAAEFVFLRDTDSLRALEASDVGGVKPAFGPDATFALDLRNEAAAAGVMAEHGLEEGKFLCAVPRLRWTPYWEIHAGSRKPDPAKIEINERFAETDHAKQRQAITASVRETGMRVLLTSEMTYAVPLLRRLLFDRLPEDVKSKVAVMNRYWLTDEAASVYAKAAALISFEQHSPIMAISAGVPAIYLRQPTDTRKGQMWRDIKLEDWIYEIDQSTGEEIAATLVAIGSDVPAAKAIAAKAKAYADDSMKAMIDAIPH